MENVLPQPDLEKGPDPKPNGIVLDVDVETPPKSRPAPSASFNGFDWSKRLDRSSSIEILECKDGSSEWQTRTKSEVEDPFSLPQGVDLRVFLVEGLTAETVNYLPSIDRDFYRYHCSNALPYDRWKWDKSYFFGKWFRRVYQTDRLSNIDFNLDRKRPHNRDMAIDPKELELEHERYTRRKSIPRLVIPLEAAIAGSSLQRKALGENVSCFYRREHHGLICVVLFDAPQSIKVDTWSPHPLTGVYLKTFTMDLPRFESLESSIVRFRRELHKVPKTVRGLEHSIQDIIAQLNINDHMDTMSDIRDALDYVDENMPDDDVLRRHIQHWRKFYGLWRRGLASDVSFIIYIKNALVHEKDFKLHRRDGIEPAARSIRVNSQLERPLLGELESLEMEVRNLSERAVSTFNAIMATMSIVESQEAIAQARTVSKLTNLAFFFIPLTLSASIFGMNIQEWENQLHTWIWIVVSLMLMILTYLVLYFPEMRTILSWKSSNSKDIGLNRKNLEGTALKINVGVLTLNYYIKKILLWCITADGLAAIFIIGLGSGLIAGYSVGIWALATKIPLSYDERVAVTVGYAIGVPASVYLAVQAFDEDFWKANVVALISVLVSIGVGTWAVFRYTPLPHSQQVTIAVGMCVGVPCVTLLWVAVYNESIYFFGSGKYLLGSLAILPPVLWAIIAKSTLSEDSKISLSVGLAVGLPALVGLWRFWEEF